MRARFAPRAPGLAMVVDLRFLHELTQQPGPFATVHLDASHDTDDGVGALLRYPLPAGA